MTTVEPAGKDDVVRTALPLVSCTVPSTVFPAVKVTGPLAVTVGDVIFAVNVTACPTVEGLGVAVREAAREDARDGLGALAALGLRS